VPPKLAESQPWEHLCVDMIGPYQIRHKGKKTLRLQAIAMINPATGWFEIAQSETKMADVVANKVETHGHLDVRGLQKLHAIMAPNLSEANFNT
jgi:hypothetical protein